MAGVTRSAGGSNRYDAFLLRVREDGTKLWDSGSQFGVVTANRYGLSFNNDNDETDGDSRSDAKGCEPEA